jgi:hypothetical protein
MLMAPALLHVVKIRIIFGEETRPCKVSPSSALLPLFPPIFFGLNIMSKMLTSEVTFGNKPGGETPSVSARLKHVSVTVGSSDTSYGVQIEADTISRPCAFHWNILVPPTAWGPHLDIAGGPMYRADPLWPPLQSLRNVAFSATHVSL